MGEIYFSIGLITWFMVSFWKNPDVVEVIYYKIPSNYYKVNYKKIVDELWNLKLDEDEEKDKLKKDKPSWR